MKLSLVSPAPSEVSEIMARVRGNGLQMRRVPARPPAPAPTPKADNAGLGYAAQLNPDSPGPCEARFWDAVAGLQKKEGLTERAAVARLVREWPEGHKSMLKEYNERAVVRQTRRRRR